MFSRLPIFDLLDFFCLFAVHVCCTPPAQLPVQGQTMHVLMPNIGVVIVIYFFLLFPHVVSA